VNRSIRKIADITHLPPTPRLRPGRVMGKLMRAGLITSRRGVVLLCVSGTELPPNLTRLISAGPTDVVIWAYTSVATSETFTAEVIRSFAS